MSLFRHVCFYSINLLLFVLLFLYSFVILSFQLNRYFMLFFIYPSCYFPNPVILLTCNCVAILLFCSQFCYPCYSLILIILSHSLILLIIILLSILFSLPIIFVLVFSHNICNFYFSFRNL